MCGMLSVQRLLSGQLARRQFLLRPPEPSPELLLQPPSQSVYVGRTKFLSVPFYWNAALLTNPHLCVVGITGSGKSYFVKTFITRARLAFGACALILDWAGEYAGWVESAGGTVLSFRDSGVNLLDLGAATPHERVRQVVESLEILTDLSSFPRQRRLTEDALEKAYLRRGFLLHRQYTGAKKKLPTLKDVQRLLSSQRREPESAEAERRIKNLLLSSGESFCSPGMRMQQLMSGLVCVDLHSLPMESLRSLAGLAMLQFVKEEMRRQEYAPKGGVRLFVVVDEAWKIASDERSDVVSIVREGRKYGFSLIVASQNPTDVHRSIFANAGTVMAFRLTLASERDYLRSSLAYSDFMESQSHAFSVGAALVHLEFSQMVPCPKTFVLQKVDGEEPLSVLCIAGDGMKLEFEKGELASQLVSFGLSDAQASSVLFAFEQHSYSLSASQFVLLLEKAGQSRAYAISLLRELGASERQLLQLFSSMGSGSRQLGPPVLLSLAKKGEKGAPGKGRGSGRRSAPAVRKAGRVGRVKARKQKKRNKKR